MADPRVTVRLEPNASTEDLAAIQTALRKFNIEFIGDPGEEPVTVFLRDGHDAVIGGLIGHIKWRWLYVAKLWIADSHRGRGHGAELMQSAEDYARSRGCIGAYLDTFEYQARPFYEKRGYQLFGTLEGFPPGYSQFYLSKQL